MRQFHGHSLGSFVQLTVVNKNVLSYDICGVTLSNGGFSFFSQEGWKNFRWGASLQVICNMPFFMLWKGHEMANQTAPEA